MGKTSVSDQIDALISEQQYIYTDEEKEALLLPIIREQLASHAANNPYVFSWLKKVSCTPENIKSLADVPLLPTQMFKHFDLQTSKGSLQRVLHSSSTTSQTPSRIPISSVTAQRQIKALLSIIKHHFSNKRKPFLIVDSPASNKDSQTITARGAAIRGFSILSKEQVYAFDDVDGKLVLNKERLLDFFQRNQEKEIFGLGFTFIIWSEFLRSLQKENLCFQCPQFTLLHGGGWKKLKAQSVSKEVFSQKIADVMGTVSERILDFYGMVEQTGLVFIDCESGNKHCPNFAEVKIRDFFSLKENGVNKPGYIEIMNVLPDSYPGMSILTEDVGEILGEDGCSCGRRGKYFVFRSRVEKSEARGCGDTFRE